MPAPESTSTPLLAVIINGLPPYRLHMHRRMARELSGYRLATLLTHSAGEPFGTPEEHQLIGLVRFDNGDDPLLQARPSRQQVEWRRGGQIIQWLSAHRPAVVVVSTYNDIGRLRVIAWCHGRRIPVLLMADSNIRGDRAGGWRAAAKRRLLRWLIRRCAAILPFGQLGREYFLKYGADPGRLFLAPCEPDYDLIENKAGLPIDAMAARFGIARDRRRFIYVGRLAPEKRVDLLIDAFASVAADVPQWDLVICGGGPLGDDLRRRVPAALGSRVIWTDNLADPREVAAMYHLCDVLVLPSDYEPWALVVNEAAAAGLALICSDAVGAAANLLEPGLNGLLFPAGDRDKLADCMASMAANDDLDRIKGESGCVLRRWRRMADPIRNINATLLYLGTAVPR